MAGNVRVDACGMLDAVLHVTDVAVSGTWVYWTTLGDVTTPPQVHRAKR